MPCLRPSFLLLLALAFSGCVGVAATPAPTPPGAASPYVGASFSEPVKLNAEGHGYEPGIKVDPHGNLFVTAHKASMTNEGTRLASWLWWSPDGGATWQEMPSPFQAHEKLPGLEGDLAIDAAGRLYALDTWGADNALSRWRLAPEGPVWESTRPLQGTLGVDDRPWLAAHGEGILYALGNNGPELPSPATLPEREGARIWLSRSTDGGLTWLPGRGFPDAAWCHLAASPADDRTLLVGCVQDDNRVLLHESGDRGLTWTTRDVGRLALGQGKNFPSVALDAEGRGLFAWIDGRLPPRQGARVHLAIETPEGSWRTHDLSPFEGSFARAWVCARDPGSAALVFHGTPLKAPNAQSEWHAYALLLSNLDAPVPDARLVRLDPRPVSTGLLPPADFFQCDVGPDGALHVVYDRVLNPDLLAYKADVMYVRMDPS